MPQAVIMVGIPGSGKSTFVQRHLFDTHVRINLDMLGTRRREAVLLRACLEAGQSFVIDNTNPTAADRRRYLPAAKAARFESIAMYFPADAAAALRRNAQRARRVPAAAVHASAKKIQPPTRDEGFDAVHTVTIDAVGNFHLDPPWPMLDQSPSR